MEEDDVLITKAYTSEMNKHRLAKIFYHLTVTTGIIVPSLLLLLFLAPVMTGMVYLIITICIFLMCVVLIICTFGVLLLEENGLIAKLWGNIEKFGNMTNSVAQLSQLCFELAKYVSFVGIACGVTSIVLLSLTNQKGRVGNIIWSSIFTGLMTLFVIVYFVGGVLGVW